ncbi:hypothetical protein FSB08_19105 [Paraburkholderia sp. JPY432]|uniref:hypothetical protein n=1 Tax=Paraburkholderia youngii TaxID=2782701 RepID=UPI001595E982|nr:hypothetical protein [Paraburkholderia youngii]NVH74587.1 hypothetical protein [Paraburkholderia youngii]
MNKVVQRLTIAAMFSVASDFICAQAVEWAGTQPAVAAPPLLFAQAGKDAGTEGGAGTAGQSGTPPGELSRDQTKREQAGRANQAAAQHGQRSQQGASAPHGASRAR